MPVLSARNRKLRLQWAHQNRTIEDCENAAWSDESGFLLRHSDGRVVNNMDPSCLVSAVQAGGGGVKLWGIFSWHTLGPFEPAEHRSNATADLSAVAEHVRLFMTAVRSSSNGYFQQNNASRHKAQIISNTITSSRDLGPTERQFHHANMEQNL